ncbi:hypothetical protein V8G54_022834 [Vigna mungo]|uniref:Uncharacterized protein n=1 Tax=Vigna mungo TaxID=3915 RepID=A0AAQ3RR02_VIGMU
MCFFKILNIISSTPPSAEQQDSFPTKGVGIDLNLRFSSLTESESSRTDTIEEEQEEGFPDKSFQLSDKLHDNHNLNNEVNDRCDSNFLDLLIEAARVVSGKHESDSEEERGLGTESTTQRANQEKRKERWVVVDIYGDVLEEREPVVRSKRGRNQALPYRFRDSHECMVIYVSPMVLPEARLQLRYGSDFGNLIKTGETEKSMCLSYWNFIVLFI